MTFRTFFLLPALVLLPVSLSVAQPPTSESGNISILPSHPGEGGGGGRVSGGNITMDTATGGAISGGVSDLNSANVQTKTGYTGQLYDPKSLAISASPGTSVAEGNAVQLSTLAIMDDETLLEPDETTWSVLSGPVSIDVTGLAVAGSVSASSAATVQSVVGSLSGLLKLTVINLPYESNPLTWVDPSPGGNGPYEVYFGTSPGALSLVATQPSPHYNPGRLAMGRTYFWQILDASGADITPGGPGPASFTTNLFRPDMRIGLKGNPATHRGNNTYNTVGAGQTAKLKLKGSRKGKLHFSVQNDGTAIDHHRVRGTKKNRKFKFIKYFKLTGGRANITAAAILSGYTRPNVRPGEVVLYQVQAKAKGKKRARRTLSIGSTSIGDSRGTDLAKGKLKGLLKK